MLLNISKTNISTTFTIAQKMGRLFHIFIFISNIRLRPRQIVKVLQPWVTPPETSAKKKKKKRKASFRCERKKTGKNHKKEIKIHTAPGLEIITRTCCCITPGNLPATLSRDHSQELVSGVDAKRGALKSLRSKRGTWNIFASVPPYKCLWTVPD